MSTPLHSEEIKKSYFNLLALVLDQEHVESDQVRCLLKWGFQLHLSPDDIRIHGSDFDMPKFSVPASEVERMETLYHLVYIIYLDRVVEDAELEVAAFYAEKLGFKKSLVGDLFQSIVTASYDQKEPGDVRKEVLEFIKINNPKL
jgi:hypothetical protein